MDDKRNAGGRCGEGDRGNACRYWWVNEKEADRLDGRKVFGWSLKWQWEGMDRNSVTNGRDKWQAVVGPVMIRRVSSNGRNCLTG